MAGVAIKRTTAYAIVKVRVRTSDWGELAGIGNVCHDAARAAKNHIARLIESDGAVELVEEPVIVEVVSTLTREGA